MSDLTISEYIKLAQRTNNPDTGTYGRETIDFVHGALGLITELKELEDAEDELNAIEELGDVTWFLALICHALKFTPWLSVISDDLRSNNELAVLIADNAKRWFAYGYDVFSDDGASKFLKNLNGSRFLVQCVFFNLVKSYGEQVVIEAMAKNIAKLQKRYPDKFNQCDAYNRDKDAEYKAIDEAGK